MSTIQKMHPVVKGMVTEMCDREKEIMKAMDQTKLGSWSKAVTCADGTWQTRGFHSKNGTFTIRNYDTGALLYFTRLCQKGRDKTITSELYKGTSKSMEGYGATQLMRKAKEEGLNIKVHWQDADSSASTNVKEYYPDAEIMICGGHAGKAHLKQLQSQAKRRKFNENLQKAHRKEFPEIESHCKEHIKEKKASKQPAGSDEKVNLSHMHLFLFMFTYAAIPTQSHKAVTRVHMHASDCNSNHLSSYIQCIV